jgi:Tol biopolymer transport system component
LTTDEGIQTPGSWSPDGQSLVFYDISPATGNDIWVLPMEGDRRPQVFLRSPAQEEAPTFSPDGRWLAFTSNESGRDEVYVQPFPGPGGKLQISTEGGNEPLWSRNGRELFYRNGDKMMAVEITTQPTFTAGSPRLLFEGRYEFSPNGVAGYDVSLDGQRFLMVQPVEPEQPATQINVVLNWFEELKRRVPSGQ